MNFRLLRPGCFEQQANQSLASIELIRIDFQQNLIVSNSFALSFPSDRKPIPSNSVLWSTWDIFRAKNANTPTRAETGFRAYIPSRRFEKSVRIPGVPEEWHPRWERLRRSHHVRPETTTTRSELLPKDLGPAQDAHIRSNGVRNSPNRPLSVRFELPIDETRYGHFEIAMPFRCGSWQRECFPSCNASSASRNCRSQYQGRAKK